MKFKPLLKTIMKRLLLFFLVIFLVMLAGFAIILNSGYWGIPIILILIVIIPDAYFRSRGHWMSR